MTKRLRKTKNNIYADHEKENSHICFSPFEPFFIKWEDAVPVISSKNGTCMSLPLGTIEREGAGLLIPWLKEGYKACADGK